MSPEERERRRVWWIGTLGMGLIGLLLGTGVACFVVLIAGLAR